MLKKVKDTIKRHGMLKKGDTVLVAVSGGVDSTVLLHTLNVLKEEFSLNIVVCHLNHNLRGRESERDFNFVKKLASDIGTAFVGKRLEKGGLKIKGVSVQEAARASRYEFLEEAARRHKASRVALGHTLDDQAETVLMRLVKGSSLAGLAGIPPVRGLFIRPLIEVGRAEIEGYAKAHGIKYVLDSSNLTTKYLRNDVRLRLIPYLKKNYNPNVIDTLARLSDILRLDDDYLIEETAKIFPDIVVERRKNAIIMDRGILLGLPNAISARAFLKAAEVLTVKSSLYSHHIKSFFNVLESARPNYSIELMDGLWLLREYDRIILSTFPPAHAEPFYAVLKVPGITPVREAGRSFKAAVLRKVPQFDGDESTAYFDYDAVAGPITIRPMSPGDRMVPIGMKGRKKLKDIFIEKKVARPERARIPLLFAADEVIWAAGVKRSDLFKVSGSTKRVLKVDLLECKG